MQINSQRGKKSSQLTKDIKEVWERGNARVTNFSQEVDGESTRRWQYIPGHQRRILEGKLHEQGLLRECEELRHQLAEKTAKCNEARQLYDKLKDAVKIKESQGWGSLFDRPVAATSPKPMSMNTMAPVLHAWGYSHHSAIPGRGQPARSKRFGPNYFPESPSRFKSQKIGPGFVGIAKTVGPRGLYPLCVGGGGPANLEKVNAVRPQFSHQVGGMGAGPDPSKPVSQLTGGFSSNPVAGRADTLTPPEGLYTLQGGPTNLEQVDVVRPPFSHQVGRMGAGPDPSKPVPQLAGRFGTNPVAGQADTLTTLETRRSLGRRNFLGDDMAGDIGAVPSSRAHIGIAPSIGPGGSLFSPLIAEKY